MEAFFENDFVLAGKESSSSKKKKKKKKKKTKKTEGKERVQDVD